MPAVLDDISAEILDLKKQIGATILAHYYQEGEIQELADFTGDSLKLARAATKVESPDHRLLRRPLHGRDGQDAQPGEEGAAARTCRPGAASPTACPADKLARYQEMLRDNGRKFQTVTYINSSAAVKALSDWVVTSGNAEEIIRRVPADYEILFVPDRHLGQYLQEVTGRKMILWDGSCMVHEIFSVGDLLKHEEAACPQAMTIAHPECPANIREHARLRRRHRGDDQVRRRRSRSRPTSWSRPRRT